MQVEWNNNRDPTKGFKYLFLSDADYTSIAARADAAVLKAEPFFAENGVWQMMLALGKPSAMTANIFWSLTMQDTSICWEAACVHKLAAGALLSLETAGAFCLGAEAGSRKR